MNIQAIINEWLAASNSFGTNKYQKFYLPDSILDDRSAGKQFVGHNENL